MNRSSNFRTPALVVAAAAAVLHPSPLPAAENITDDLAAVRSTYTADRKAFLAQNLQLTGSELTIGKSSNWLFAIT